MSYKYCGFIEIFSTYNIGIQQTPIEKYRYFKRDLKFTIECHCKTIAVFKIKLK